MLSSSSHYQRGAWLYRRSVTRGWTELARRQLDNLSADTALRCVRILSATLATKHCRLIRTGTAPSTPQLACLDRISTAILFSILLSSTGFECRATSNTPRPLNASASRADGDDAVVGMHLASSVRTICRLCGPVRATENRLGHGRVYGPG